MSNPLKSIAHPATRRNPTRSRSPRRAGWLARLATCAFLLLAGLPARAAAPPAGRDPLLAARYPVSRYVIQGKTLLSTNITVPLFAQYTGNDISMEQIVRAAADLQFEYGRQGYPTMNVVIAPRRIARGMVTFDVFPGAVAQIWVAGVRYTVAGNGVVAAAKTPAETAPALAIAANTPAAAATNAGPRFTVRNYLVTGNTVLRPEVIGKSLAAVPAAFGTNVTLEGIRSAVTELQGAYRARGYVTVAVGLPPQRLTNAIVKVQVTEGRLASITVKGNHYFSSNNVMRALPGLHTNQILNGLTFQAELNRANANPDRQIYPLIGPGPDPGSSDLILKVKDRPPVHAKVDFNNESSPGTPGLRVNTSAVYNNLWQQEQSAGLQYSFAPELYKQGSQWDFYDLPVVANYSGFYRLPLGAPANLEEVVAGHPDAFGYNEATRKFVLPPASGQPDLTLFASRSTIDTGLNTTFSGVISSDTGNSVSETDVQQDITVNNDLGFRLNLPLAAATKIRSDFSGGLDFKTYQINSIKTNTFFFSQTNYTGQGTPIYPPIITPEPSPGPTTVKNFQYLPLMIRYNGGWQDSLGTAAFGLGVSANLWYSGLTSSRVNTEPASYYRDLASLRQITGSTESSGHWVILTPSFSHSLEWVTNWPVMFEADGQWASEPLLSNEQFGAGGVNSVRGYHEGQVFGDTGWHISFEQDTPAHVVGMVTGSTPMTIRGSVYMDYADTYFLDPPAGAPGRTALWGTGFGGVISVGSHWEARFLFSVPLQGTSTTSAYDPFFNFSLTAQF